MGLQPFHHRPARNRKPRPEGVRLERWLRHSVGQRPRRGPRRHPLNPGALLHRKPGGRARLLDSGPLQPVTSATTIRRKQFAMLQPAAAGRIDVGLIMPPGTSTAGWLESAAKFYGLFGLWVGLWMVGGVGGGVVGWVGG